MVDSSDEETLRRFVLRARRVQAHSLVQNWNELLYHADGSFEGNLDVTGRFSFTRRLPDNEEAFESLAARIRPLTLKSEPVYYETVFKALERLLTEEAAVDEPEQKRFDQLRRAWSAAEIQGTQTRAYAVQSIRVDGTEATTMVSDTQLAAGWLYADLVHADAQGPKREALAFPLRERYAAAVRLFSHIAALTVETLRLVESLRDAGTISLTVSAWDEDVVIGTTELSEEARAFVAAPGATKPDLRDSLCLGEEWSQVTVTELLRQDPANRVRVVLKDEHGSTIASYDAAVVHRKLEENAAHWQVLVAGSAIFKFSFDLEGEHMVGGHLVEGEAFDSTNELKLSSTVLLIQLHRATTMKFELRGQEFVTLGPPTSSAKKLRELEVVAETVGDIVTIERLSGQRCDPCNGTFDDRDRVRLRRVRLVWEGQVVHAMRHPVTVTAPTGAPPQVVVVAAGTLDVGGASVPTLTTYMRHSAMTCTEQGDDAEVGAEAKKFEVCPPQGEQFIAWAPERVQVLGDDDLVPTASWGLIGIDESMVTY